MAKKDKIDRDEIEQEYGLSYALFKAFPELDDLLHKAVNGSWTATKFQVELRQTKWFAKHSDSWRKMTALKYSDPTTYQERLAQARSNVQNLARQYGANNFTKKSFNRLVERSLLFGLDEGQIRDLIASHVKPSDGHYGGDLASIEQQLRQTAYSNGIRLHQEQLTHWMRQIVRGNQSVQNFENHIRDVAAKTFSAYGAEIKGGMNVSDMAAPYMQSMADVLEINPSTISMFNPLLRRAMTHKNDKGEVQPMSIADFEDYLRQQPRWQHTDAAKKMMTGYAVKLGEMFGVV